ncbi:MAG: hypothetical protein U5K71_02430 [Gracilimonas sp.]|nr:hypothetical protein [Gracilimonas sp.]
MQYQKNKYRLEVELPGDFNLNSVRMISEELGDRRNLHIDLSHAHFVNSKAIIFMHKFMFGEKNGKIRLKNPPKLFYELLQTLGLHTTWNLDEIVEP